MDEGKEVINGRGGKDVDLDKFDESIFSGDRYYDIFDKEEEIITEGSIVWVNTNRTIWEGRVIKIPFSDVPEDAKHLKLMWINTATGDKFKKMGFRLEKLCRNICLGIY